MSIAPIMAQNPIIYLIPGQGSDHRIYKNMELDSAFETRHITYSIPERGMTMEEYARVLSAQIDTTQPYVLVGISLGGMIATEMSAFMRPEKVIVISSAKARSELPGKYTFQRWMPLYRIMPGGVSKLGAQVLQPLVEPDRNFEEQTCKRMLRDKHPKFMKRTIRMIMEWNREVAPKHIHHIHGDNDHTLPIRHVHSTAVIEGGSHMMALTHGAEISACINALLNEGQKIP